MKLMPDLLKASAAFGRLYKNVWNRRGISTTTKIKVYRAMVLTTLLYGCETWTVYRRHARKLNHFHTTCLRKLLGIKWQDRIPDTEVLTRANLPSIYTKAQDRGAWQTAVHKGAEAYEANRTVVAVARRQARKARTANPVAAANIPCPHCQRLFRAQIGLTSHLRTHQAND
nr:uncharacterized protein LOC129261526 [Lytechinus pictus]